MRKRLIIANWKLNNTIPDALKFVAALTSDLKVEGSADVAIAAPFTVLYSLGVALAETDFKLAAQNIFWEDNGAYTGEISGEFLTDVGCTYVLVGHSERREIFSESDDIINKKIKAAQRNHLVPVLCVGEKLADREAGKTWDVIERQLRADLKSLDVWASGDFVIAYEPVWAIGTGKTATTEQAQEVHEKIRKFIASAYDADSAAKMRIIYGGSVKPSNSRELLSMADIDGALVGGASLDAKQFSAIARSAH